MSKEEGELDLSPGDWWDIGWAEGHYYKSVTSRPPEEPARKDAYEKGRAAGEFDSGLIGMEPAIAADDANGEIPW